MSDVQSIRRAILDDILNRTIPGKAIVILGPRRAGKSHLLREIVALSKEEYIFLNGEDAAVARLLGDRTYTNYGMLIGQHKLLVIDEAQKIPNIGPSLKFLVDSFPDLKIIATGSSMFDLDQNLGEPLTGRKQTYHLYPFAQMELNQVERAVAIKSNLEDRLIFGSYPELQRMSTREEKAEYLKEIVNSYLLKDILALDSIRNSQKIYDLLRLLALQVGQQVSLAELGNAVGMSKNTVERYFDLLEKCFVIQRVQGFSRNMRKEIVKMSKWYFLDNGIRNTIIANHNPLALRTDTGALWENYLVMERMKYQSIKRMLVHNYFWRTYDQQELDWVEDRGGKLYGFEFKWNENKIAKVPSGWASAYPDAVYSVINPSNYLQWISGDGMSSEEKMLVSDIVKPKKAKTKKKSESKKRTSSSVKAKKKKGSDKVTGADAKKRKKK